MSAGSPGRRPPGSPRILHVDNRTCDLAGYDDELLAEILEGLPSLEGTGFSERALQDLLDEVAPPPLEEEELTPPPAEPKTRPGDLYALSGHRLLCGDATKAADLERLMGAERAKLLWTDPAYGVAYEGRTRAQRGGKVRCPFHENREPSLHL